MGVKIWVNKGHIYLSLCYGGKQWREGTGLTIPKTKTLEKEVMKAAEALRCKREIEMATSRAGMMPPEERGLSLYEYAEKKGTDTSCIGLSGQVRGAEDSHAVAVEAMVRGVPGGGRTR